MYIPHDPTLAAGVLLLGFIGWIAKGIKKLGGRANKETVKEGISRAAGAADTERKRSAESRKTAERAVSSAPLTSQRVTKRQMSRNMESRGAYRRRTGR